MQSLSALKIERAIGPGLTLRSWTREAVAPMVADANAHDGIELTWVEAGAVGYRIGARGYEAVGGQAMVVPAGVEHTTGFPGPVRARSLHLSAHLTASISDAVWPRAPRRPGVGLFEAPDRLVRLGELLRDELEHGGEGSDLMVHALVDALVLQLLRAAAPSPSVEIEPRLRHALELMATRYAEPLSIDDLAQAAEMSRHHFGRRFRAATGRSPYQHLLEIRLQHAATRLRRARASVTEAAFDAGFPDLGRFHRAFRARFGTSPAEYRQRA